MSLVRLPRLARNGDTVYVLDALRARLEDAERRLAAPITVRSADSGWRAYSEQRRFYDLYRAGKGNLASNPDTGERGHMRGASIDIFREDAAAQNAMRAAGFVRDRLEPWHWNLPGVTGFPIIKTLPVFVPTIAARPAFPPPPPALPPKGFLMALSDARQEQLDKNVQFIADQLNGGWDDRENYKITLGYLLGHTLPRLLPTLERGADDSRIILHAIDGTAAPADETKGPDGKPVPYLRLLARRLLNPPAASIDVAALAAELKRLGVLAVDVKIDDATLQRIGAAARKAIVAP